MDYISYTKKLNRIKQLAEKGITGKPESLATELGISQRTLRRMLTNLRFVGVDITYCRKCESYIIKEL